ncbi:Site-specific recombinase XerD [Mucilaginibacter lappiensis]|uniref:Integrase n=1 Tax=Mucilaginibacter lappiensis TaxID=354630 RepID=A0ABR6PKF5_9SPHI|nr:tyrosine-type recombinase/integrase [Mucilaginibacter lappiensis]MBB6109694.1 integrase [Mucilaginibacter lappiensis]SIR12083.1 Site-specific recombinase XerD [Mucilaginibacter lappiensis]
MSINLKVRLFKGKTHADGTHPIQLQFYLNGKVKKKGIYSCQESDWDYNKNRVKSKVPNSAYINNLISEKYTEYERELIKVINGESPANFFEENKELTLDFVLQQELIRYKKEVKPMTESRVKGYRNELYHYFDSENTLIKDINLRWFERYAAFLTNDLLIDGKLIRPGNIGTTSQKKIKDVRRVIEKWSSSPLTDDVKKFRIPTKKPMKQKLTASELHSIESLVLKEGSILAVSRDIFLMQVYLRGCRIGALLQAYSSQFKDGRYTADNTTGKNNVDSKLIPKAQQIVNKYKGKSQRLFPLFNLTHDPKLSEFDNQRRTFKHKQSCTTIVNKNLKEVATKAGINKPLSSHIARHTFARMAIDKINNPMVTMELLGHSSLAVHQQYLNDIRKEDVLDQAADEIFG